MSCLAISFMTVDEKTLRILQEEGTNEERRYVERIQPLIANKHLLSTFL
jgi:hypothetical protein